jgi:rubredoxin
MNARQLIDESFTPRPKQHSGAAPKPIEFRERIEKDWVCPHCKDVIHEKHTYVHEGKDFHSDCGGAIIFPPPSPEEQKWLDGFKKHLSR